MRTLTRTANGLQVSSILARTASKKPALFIPQPQDTVTQHNATPHMPSSTPDFSMRDPILNVLQEYANIEALQTDDTVQVETTITPSVDGQGIGPSNEGAYVRMGANAQLTFSIAKPGGQRHPGEVYTVQVGIERGNWSIEYLLDLVGGQWVWAAKLYAPDNTNVALPDQIVPRNPNMGANVAWGEGLIGQAFRALADGSGLAKADPDDPDDLRPLPPSVNGEYSVRLLASPLPGETATLLDNRVTVTLTA